MSQISLIRLVICSHSVLNLIYTKIQLINHLSEMMKNYICYVFLLIVNVSHLSISKEQTPSILGFRPRSFGLPPSMQYPVEFPLARPTPRNLDDICLYGDRRPHYPDSYFPSSGYGQLKRQAKAVNRVESWYRSCCERNQTWASGVTLCCAQRAVSLYIIT